MKTGKTSSSFTKRFIKTGKSAIKHRSANRAHLNRKRTSRYVLHTRSNKRMDNSNKFAKKVRKLIL